MYKIRRRTPRRELFAEFIYLLFVYVLFDQFNLVYLGVRGVNHSINGTLSLFAEPGDW